MDMHKSKIERIDTSGEWWLDPKYAIFRSFGIKINEIIDYLNRTEQTQESKPTRNPPEARKTRENRK